MLLDDAKITLLKHFLAVMYSGSQMKITERPSTLLRTFDTNPVS
jgi:hypothetical protein